MNIRRFRCRQGHFNLVFLTTLWVVGLIGTHLPFLHQAGSNLDQILSHWKGFIWLS